MSSATSDPSSSSSSKHLKSTHGADWTRLPTEFLSIIFFLLPSNSDCIACHSVCSSWRSAAPRLLPFPLLLYPPPLRLDEDGHHFCNFADLVASRFGTVDLPELRAKVLCGSTDCWLVLRGNGLRPPFPISAFNPLTGRHFHLPPLTAAAPPEKIVLTSLPPYPFAAVAILGWDLPLQFWEQESGTSSWSSLQRSSSCSFHDAISCCGTLYAVDSSRKIYEYEPIGPDTVPTELGDLDDREVVRKKNIVEKNYFVESLGKLFLVIRTMSCKRDQYAEHYEFAKIKTKKMEVFRLDLCERKWRMVKKMGDGVFFVGVNTSFSLTTANMLRWTRSQVKSMREVFYENMVFFTGDGFNHLGEVVGKEEDVGYFSVKDDEFTGSLRGVNLPSPALSPAIFFVPSL